MSLQKAKHCSCCGCPTTHQVLQCSKKGKDFFFFVLGGGCLSYCQQQLKCDKERAAQPWSDMCIIVVVAKCSSLIIPPSFANGAAAHFHINAVERRVWCQGLRVKHVAKLWKYRGHHPYNKQNPPVPPEPSRPRPHPLCLSIINSRNGTRAVVWWALTS